MTFRTGGSAFSRTYRASLVTGLHQPDGHTTRSAQLWDSTFRDNALILRSGGGYEVNEDLRDQRAAYGKGGFTKGCTVSIVGEGGCYKLVSADFDGDGRVVLGPVEGNGSRFRRKVTDLIYVGR